MDKASGVLRAGALRLGFAADGAADLAAGAGASVFGAGAALAAAVLSGPLSFLATAALPLRMVSDMPLANFFREDFSGFINAFHGEGASSIPTVQRLKRVARRCNRKLRETRLPI